MQAASRGKTEKWERGHREGGGRKMLDDKDEKKEKKRWAASTTSTNMGAGKVSRTSLQGKAHVPREVRAQEWEQ